MAPQLMGGSFRAFSKREGGREDDTCVGDGRTRNAVEDEDARAA